MSLNGVGFQRYHVEMESYSFRSTSLRCLEENSISVEFDKKNLKREYVIIQKKTSVEFVMA